MLTLGSLAFATPWILLGLAVLPLIWLLLRVTPPAPRQQLFPAIRLLFGLHQREETPARTPWWLILLRLVLAALVILGLAHPLLNPGGKLPGSGPLILAIDDGWAAARLWQSRQRDAVDLLDVAERDNRPVVLLTTARQPGGEASSAIGPQRAAEIRTRVQALAPKPWPVDRETARQAVDTLQLGGPAQAVYYADGLDDPALAPLAESLQRLGALRVVTAPQRELPILLLPPENRAGEVDVVAKRVADDQPQLAIVRALAADGRLLARETLTFEPNAARATVRLKLPVELRNSLTRLEIEGQEQTGAVVLLDERWQRRPVGVVSSTPLEGGQSLLEDTYYMERALGPFAEIRRGSVGDLLRSQLAVILVADDAPLADADRAALKGFADNGGVVVRFAGTRLADGKSDDLVPVRLRPGGRELGTALQWTTPAHLAPFKPTSPFAGLAVPDEVTISRQVLAEPALDLPEKSWAQLADGTPLVTADKRGAGWLVLFHVPANAEWSNLALSGLFVEMLRRLVALSRGVASGVGSQPLPPLETLDGFGRLQAAPASATALLPEEAKNGVWRVDPR
ncbi:MAG: BatA domain-containing protein, partial [Alphaproteobacteria bacterium]|nr:BatA domain-containing protein [Alphaproteobacteria bacterium]